MLCREAMNPNVQTCHPYHTATRCAEVMLEHDIGCVPIVDGRGKPIGIVTDRDLALRVLAGKLPVRTELSHIMSTNVLTCRADEPLSAAEERMARSQKSRIVVVNEAGAAVGVLSLSDIAQAEAAERAGKLLISIARREAPARSAGA